MPAFSPTSGLALLMMLTAMSCSEVLSGQRVPESSSVEPLQFDSNLTTLDTHPKLSLLTVKHLAAKTLLYQVGRQIRIVGVPTLVSVGVVGNVLSFLVMIQEANRRISCCIYLAAVAVCDLFAVITTFAYWSTTNAIRVTWTNVQCKVVGYTFSASAMSSVLLVMFVTVDRFIAVRFPLRAKEYCSTTRAKWMCIGIVIAVWLCQLPHLRYFTQKGLICQAFGVRDRYAVAFVWFNTALNSLVPFLVLSVLNGLIMATVRQRAKQFDAAPAGGEAGQDSGGSSKDNASKVRDNQMITMLLLVTTALLLFTIPQYIRYIVYLFIAYTDDADSYAMYFFWYSTTHTWFLANYSTNFFMYCFGGSKFRTDLADLFRCKKK